MKLDEITLVDGHGNKNFNISEFDINNGERIGYSEGGTIITKSHHNIDSRLILFSLTNENNLFLSGVVGYFFPFNGREYFLINDVFTSREQRNKGYATALYTSLVRKYHVKLMSGKTQTKDGKLLWDRLSKVLTVNVYDAKTKTTVPRNQISDDDIYVNEPDRYILLVERCVVSIHDIGIPNIGDGIIKDILNYTHPINEGKYE